MKKIIYFRYIPLTATIYNLFYMEELANEGFEVEYWDLSALFFSEMQIKVQEDSSHLTKTTKFDSYKQLEDKLSLESIDFTLFVSIVTLEIRVEKLFRILTKYNCRTAVFAYNVLPVEDRIMSNSYLRRLMKITPSKLVHFFKTRAFDKNIIRGKIKPYDVIFQGGSLGWRAIGASASFLRDKAEIVNVNSNDYDVALMYKMNPDIEQLTDTPYILFLDQYYPFHPDIILFESENKLEAEVYYRQLCAYFSKIEEQYNMPVVVAAHPKALKYKEHNYFEGRKVFFGSSALLCRDAVVILTHDSTAISFAVVNDVPVVLLTSNAIKDALPEIFKGIDFISRYLGAPLVHYDQNNAQTDFPLIISNAYSEYKYQYLTSLQTEDMQSVDIVINFLKQYN